MTLTEYISQQDPARMPDVELRPGEYQKGITIKHISGIERTQVRVTGFGGEYCLKEGSTRLWTTDGDGNPVRPSVFLIPDIFNKMLDISTEHIRPETASILREAKEGLLPFRHVLRHQYGFTLWCTEPEIHHDHEWKAFPELAEINRVAYEAGCILINIDQDAAVHDRFPTFNW